MMYVQHVEVWHYTICSFLQMNEHSTAEINYLRQLNLQFVEQQAKGKFQNTYHILHSTQGLNGIHVASVPGLPCFRVLY